MTGLIILGLMSFAMAAGWYAARVDRADEKRHAELTEPYWEYRAKEFKRCWEAEQATSKILRSMLRADKKLHARYASLDEVTSPRPTRGDGQ